MCERWKGTAQAQTIAGPLDAAKILFSLQMWSHCSYAKLWVNTLRPMLCTLSSVWQPGSDVVQRFVQDWLKAKVPGTALGTLVHNKLLPHPYISLNNQQIPDLFHHPEYYTFWWHNTFSLPMSWQAQTNQHAWLWLHGINYSVEAYMNGHLLPLQEPEGMFIRRKIHVTDFIEPSTSQELLLLIKPPKPPGCVDKG